MKRRYFAPVALALAACQSPDADVTTPVPTIAQAIAATSQHHAPSQPKPGGRLPEQELAQARRATARYQDVKRAYADGYRDIDVVLPNMGRHFLNESLLDGRFEAERPELLVYSPGDRGAMTLVAVEYAVPLNLSVSAPDGFGGVADEWFADQTFKLWTLHAWVWRHNPDGIFNPTNRHVP